MSHTSTLSTGKLTIAVCGATGVQGGSVVRHLLNDGRFSVRALTREPDSERAKEIANLGAEVVQADFDDLASLCRSFKGCYGVFGNTDNFGAFDKEAEHGRNIVDAAKAEGIKHLIMSTAPRTPAFFQHKATTATYLRQSGVPFTLFFPSLYYSSLFLFDALTRDHKTGGWRCNFPFPTDIPIPCISPKDLGAYILVGFTNPSEWIGNDIKIVNQFITPRQFAETIADITESPVEIREVTIEDFFAMEHGPYLFGGWEVFKWHIDEYNNGNPTFSVEDTRRLYSEFETFRDYAMEHMGIPREQQMAIQFVRTHEHFSEHSVSS